MFAAIAFVAALGCAHPEPRTFEVGAHRVRLVVPAGWEHLDHGRQHLFRRGEAWCSLTDFGLVADGEEAASPPPSADSLARRVLERVTDLRRYEVARLAHRVVNGAEWVEIETWDRVSHLGRARLACLEAEGRLLVLQTEHGPIESTGPAYEALLNSIETASLGVVNP